jgi:hypothetical protein
MKNVSTVGIATALKANLFVQFETTDLAAGSLYAVCGYHENLSGNTSEVTLSTYTTADMAEAIAWSITFDGAIAEKNSDKIAEVVSFYQRVNH